MSEKKKSHGCLFAGMGCLSVIGVLAVVFVVTALRLHDEESDKKEVSISETSVEDLSAEVKRGQELIDWLRVKNNQTDLQNDAALDRFKGRKIIVRGKVRDVGKTTFGGDVYVSLTVGQMDMFERANIQFNISDSMVSQVSSWHKNEQRVLRGKVKGLGDQIEDDVICVHTEVVADEKFENLLHQ